MLVLCLVIVGPRVHGGTPRAREAMPLLRSSPFSPDLSLPADLSPAEEVFVVRATGEVFRNYEYVPHARTHGVGANSD